MYAEGPSRRQSGCVHLTTLLISITLCGQWDRNRILSMENWYRDGWKGEQKYWRTSSPCATLYRCQFTQNGLWSKPGFRSEITATDSPTCLPAVVAADNMEIRTTRENSSCIIMRAPQSIFIFQTMFFFYFWKSIAFWKVPKLRPFVHLGKSNM